MVLVLVRVRRLWVTDPWVDARRGLPGGRSGAHVGARGP